MLKLIEVNNHDLTETLTDKLYEQYLADGTCIKISGLCKGWAALEKWNFPYFSALAEDLEIPLKTHMENGEIVLTNSRLSDYIKAIEAYERCKESNVFPPYCHDIPIFHLIKTLVEDVNSFPLNFLPAWYRHEWWDFAQFFMSPSGSVTPLHFDTLLTNNFFVQIYGTKEFIVFPFSDAENCYRTKWRWFQVDPKKPNFDKFPLYEKAKPTSIILNPGDALIMPSGTMHHVTTVDASISFNIDFHNKTSLVNAFSNVKNGMPEQNLFYNSVISTAILSDPAQTGNYLRNLYKSYVNYVS